MQRAIPIGKLNVLVVIAAVLALRVNTTWLRISCPCRKR